MNHGGCGSLQGRAGGTPTPAGQTPLPGHKDPAIPVAIFVQRFWEQREELDTGQDTEEQVLSPTQWVLRGYSRGP